MHNRNRGIRNASMGPVPTERFVLVAKMSRGDVMAYATCIGGEATVSLKP
jgi:hypothetical protein